MTEIRYTTEYTYPDNLKPKDRVPANASVAYVPHTVSDEDLEAELEAEAREEAIAEITAEKKAEIKERRKE